MKRWFQMPAARTTRKTRQAVVNTPPANPDPELMDEVPVQRVAEYIPASFVAVGDDVQDALNDREARIYKVSDHTMALVFNAGILEFNIEALEKVCARCQTMSITDLNEMLDLEPDDDEEFVRLAELA